MSQTIAIPLKVSKITLNKKMKIISINILLLLSMYSYGQVKLTPDDLKVVTGKWEGSITYLDYQTNEPYTMPANLIVTQGKCDNTLLLENIYPNEPKANSKDKIKITKKGQRLNRSEVTYREKLESGDLKIQTEKQARDDNKKALIRNTYIVSEDVFLIRKEVQFEASDEWIKRSEFSYQR